MVRRLFRVLAGLKILTAAALASLLLTGAASAQTFPSKPIRVIIPYPAGGTVDVMLRRLVQKINDANGPQVVIESRPGGGGVVAAQALMQAPNDGYTIMVADVVSHALNVTMVPNLPYDPVKDFEPITMLFSFPTLLAVPAASPVKSMADLIALAKSKPGGLSYGSAGIGTAGHLLGTMLQKASDAPMTHVAYRGGQAALTDLVAGRIDYLFFSYSALKPFLVSNDLRLIATAADKRLPAAANVPTLTEAGYPNIDYDSWFGLAAPKGTDPQVIAKLREIFIPAQNSPDLVAALNEIGFVARTGPAADLTALIKSDTERMGKMYKDSGASVN